MRTLHRNLYKKIPSFKCMLGCTDCYGPVPFSEWEWSRIKDKRQAKGLKCPYASRQGCEIYEQRPFVCRLYGAIEILRCPYGRGPGKLLPDEEAKKVLL